MRSWIKWVVGIAMIVILVGIGYIWYHSSFAIKLPPPDELGANYDPTQNVAKFKIEQIGDDGVTLRLVGVWPKPIEGLKVASSITCPLDDLKIVKKGRNKSTIVSMGEFYQEMAENPKDLMILTGNCSDAGCTKLNKGCELYVGTYEP
jgi:hypothetical protein